MDRAAQISEQNSPQPSGSGDADRPSIFELVAQDSLMSSLRPAMKFVSRVLAVNNPRRFSKLYIWYDEIHTALELLLQNHFLGKFGASFAEQFYGLERVVARTGQAVVSGSRWKSLAVLVLFPYIKTKLTRVHDVLKQRVEEGRRFPNPRLQTFAEAFVKAFPVICGLLELWMVAMQAGYMIGRTNSHSPLLWLVGVTLRRAQEPLEAVDAVDNRILPLRLLSKASSALFHFLSKILGVSLFLIQFLDWWYSEKENVPKAQAMNRTIPPAPQKLLREIEVLNLDPKLCPLCERPRRNHTVLTVSGFAFCYPCIHKYLDAHGRCPVTGLPAGRGQLMRLFLDTSALI